MNKQSFYDYLLTLLKKDSRFIDEDGDIIRNAVIDKALKYDEQLLSLLIGDKKLKGVFFKEINKSLVFLQNIFIDYIQDKNFLIDSYTKYKNKIGLTIDGKYLGERNEVALVWPFKDCVLEGGMTKEDQKRNEIFFNEVLAKDEIDRLFEPKVLTNFKRYTKNGGEKVTEINRDSDGVIRENLIIKGNNLLAMYSLKKQFTGEVKLIYIDPPYYFSGTKFTDSFAYNTNFKLSSWLVFMKNRLSIAKELLSENGVIFIQISDEGLAHLKLLADDVFLPSNYLNTITVKAKASSGASGGGEDKKMKKNSEFVLLFCKNKAVFEYKPIYTTIPIEKYIDDHKQDEVGFYYTRVLVNVGKKDLIKEIKGLKIYEHKGFEFETVSNLMKTQKLSCNEVYSKYFNKIFMVTNAQTSILEKVNEIIQDKNKLVSYEYIPKSGRNKNKTTIKYVWNKTLVVWFADSAASQKGEVSKLEEVGSLWTDISWGRLDIEGSVDFKSGKKPEELIKRVIDLSTGVGDIVLDYHLGSGTTCAVAHKMGRQYIGIEQLDYGENDSIVRLKNVINGDQSGISKAVDWQGGESFIYCELKKYNEEFIDRIQDAKSTAEILDIWEDMKGKSFLNYQLDIKKHNEAIREFKVMTLDKQKQALVELLDKNALYVPFSDIDDKDFKVSSEDKALNKKFYG